jgi:hypothetical protein
VEEMFLAMVLKTMKLHVLLYVVEATTMFANFDFWMSKGGMDTFALTTNYTKDF